MVIFQENLRYSCVQFVSCSTDVTCKRLTPLSKYVTDPKPLPPYSRDISHEHRCCPRLRKCSVYRQSRLRLSSRCLPFAPTHMPPYSSWTLQETEAGVRSGNGFTFLHTFYPEIGTGLAKLPLFRTVYCSCCSQTILFLKLHMFIRAKTQVCRAYETAVSEMVKVHSYTGSAMLFFVGCALAVRLNVSHFR